MSTASVLDDSADLTFPAIFLKANQRQILRTEKLVSSLAALNNPGLMKTRSTLKPLLRKHSRLSGKSQNGL